jgi:hypothetical protein
VPERVRFETLDATQTPSSGLKCVSNVHLPGRRAACRRRVFLTLNLAWFCFQAHTMQVCRRINLEYTG